MATRLQQTLEGAHRLRGILVAIGIVLLPLIILAPIPPVGIDLLLSFNIALAILVLLTTAYVKSPLEFSVFPSLLLVATLFPCPFAPAQTEPVTLEIVAPPHSYLGRSFEVRFTVETTGPQDARERDEGTHLRALARGCAPCRTGGAFSMRMFWSLTH